MEGISKIYIYIRDEYERNEEEINWVMDHEVVPTVKNIYATSGSNVWGWKESTYEIGTYV